MTNAIFICYNINYKYNYKTVVKGSDEMKKLLALILAMLMLLCSCDWGAKREYEIGETIVTKNWEFTLEKVYIGEAVSADREEKGFYVEYGDYNRLAGEGETIVGMAFSMKYLGKEEVSTMFIPEPWVEYGNGYKFENDFLNNKMFVWQKSDMEFECVHDTSESEFSPLDPKKEFRLALSVPAEVKTNTSETLKIAVELDRKTYHFIVR